MKCKIYFIKCLETGEIYIGSTKKKYLSKRIAGHIKDRKCTAIQILDRGNYTCDILEEVEESERFIREQHYIDITDNCINKYKAYTGLNRDDYEKQYRLDNEDKIKDYQKQYRLDHKDEAKEYHKQYKLDNKDKLKEYNSQKYTCECGQVLSIASKRKHEKRTRHQDYLKSSH